MPLLSKLKTPTKMKILEEKKIWRSLFFEFAERHVFRLSKITNFEGVFGFCNKGTPYFDCVKHCALKEVLIHVGLFHTFFG